MNTFPKRTRKDLRHIKPKLIDESNRIRKRSSSTNLNNVHHSIRVIIGSTSRIRCLGVVVGEDKYLKQKAFLHCRYFTILVTHFGPPNYASGNVHFMLNWWISVKMRLAHVVKNLSIPNRFGFVCLNLFVKEWFFKKINSFYFLCLFKLFFK